jgi:ribosomal protein S12 methylthiotransferase
VVTGCLPQRFGRELSAELPEVDVFLGTGEFPRIADLLERAERGALKQNTFIGRPTYLYDHRTPRIYSGSPGSIYIKIAEGCSNRCAYCVIPQIRGGLRSRTIPSILREAEEAVSRGAKEVNLIAQDITAFGDDHQNADLVRLLERLVRLESLRWIRLLYTHPAHLPLELIPLIRDEEKICKYLDLPLQHIDDPVLRAMNRPVSSAFVRDLIARLRQEIPNISLRTSLMVGFPGETEKSFSRLLEFVEEVRFDHLGVFRYSPQEGTPAASMKGQISETVKAKRFDRIMSLQKRISRARLKNFVGASLEVLVEKPGRSPLSWVGRWAGQAPEVDGVVYVAGESARPGEMVRVKIIRAGAYDLYGEIPPAVKRARDD